MPNDNSQNQEEPSSATQPVFGAPTTQFSPNAAQPLGVKQPKKSKKTLFAVLSAIGVVVLVAGGTITYLLLNNKTSEPAAKTDATVLPALGDSLKASLEDPTNASVLVYKSSNPATVIQKVEGSVWMSSDGESTVLSFNSGRSEAANNENDYSRVVEHLKSEGLTEVKTSDGVSVAYSSDKAVVQYFSSDVVACVLRNKPEVGTYSLQVDCANQFDFNKNKTAIKPLAEAYVASKENANTDILFSKPDVQDSVTKDYKTARVNAYSLDYSGDSSIAAFYETPDEKWHFFTVTKEQDKVTCDSYKDTDHVNAYLGFTCWDTSTNSSSFVQKDEPTFEIVPDSAG